MLPYLNITLNTHPCVIAPEKALFLPEFGTLVVSDLHFGKVAHFRKYGIGVPAIPDHENLYRLECLFNRFPATRLLFVGDAFHSVENSAVALFKQWRERFSHMTFDLIEGNHDIMKPATYNDLGISQVGKEVRLGKLAFLHDPADAALEPGVYYLAGHVHPGARLEGKTHGLTLPAFIVGEQVALLPAFGQFTGRFALKTKDAQAVYVFSGEKVYALPTAKASTQTS